MRMFTFCSLAALMFASGILAGCLNTGQPSCADNPRNMSCMTAPQLERELSK